MWKHSNRCNVLAISNFSTKNMYAQRRPPHDRVGNERCSRNRFYVSHAYGSCALFDPGRRFFLLRRCFARVETEIASDGFVDLFSFVGLMLYILCLTATKIPKTLSFESSPHVKPLVNTSSLFWIGKNFPIQIYKFRFQKQQQNICKTAETYIYICFISFSWDRFVKGFDSVCCHHARARDTILYFWKVFSRSVFFSCNAFGNPKTCYPSIGVRHASRSRSGSALASCRVSFIFIIPYFDKNYIFARVTTTPRGLRFHRVRWKYTEKKKRRRPTQIKCIKTIRSYSVSKCWFLIL